MEVPLGPGAAADAPHAIAATDDRSTALVVHRDTDNLTFFDIGSGVVFDTLEVGNGPTDVVVVPGGPTALVVNRGSDDVSLVSVDARTEIVRIPVSISAPERAVVSADGATAVVGGRAGANWEFSVLDLSSQAEIDAFGHALRDGARIQRRAHDLHRGPGLRPDT